MLRDAPASAFLPAVDVERAAAFYAEKLGLRRADSPTIGHEVVFEAGVGTLLYVYEWPPGTTASHTVAGWSVDDIEAAVEELRQRGVEFEQYDRPGLKSDELGIVELDEGKTAWFKDTEGNLLMLAEFTE